MRPFLLGSLALASLTAAAAAMAEPAFRWGVSGSSFLIYARNSEPRQFTCSYSFTLTHTDYGETKSNNFNGSFGVKAGTAEQLVVNTSTTWAGSTLQLTNGPQIRCT